MKEILILMALALSHLASAQIIDTKICSKEGKTDACAQIARDGKLACTEYRHKVDCMIDIDLGNSHVGAISPEEAFLGASRLSDNVVVIGEIVKSYPVPQTVVLVRSSSSINSIGDLRGKKFCHPGYKHDDAFSVSMLKELELEIVNRYKTLDCSQNSPILEKHISAISEFFGDSCRPGPWTENDVFDQTLKEKYSSLCTLCGNEKCNVNYNEPFKNALECLKNNNADVAVTTLREATIFLNSSETRQQYQYLCKDGTNRPADDPCFWSEQLPSLIIARSNYARDLSSYLQEKLKSKIYTTSPQTYSADFSEQYFATVLGLGKDRIKFLTKYETLKQYVEARRSIPSVQDLEKCNIKMKWCTYSDLENEKCNWLSQAALNRAIQPPIECVRSDENEEINCLEDVQKGKADFVVASSEFAYISFKKDLEGIAYPETDTRNLSTVLIVKRSNDNTINNFKDLKSKRACLPQYGGREFLAFVPNIYKQRLNEPDNECNYAKTLNNFVSSACVPGALSYQENDQEDFTKLCQTCKSFNATRTAIFCDADESNIYFGDEGALRCLNSGDGDYAVITKPQNIENYTNLTVLCKNGQLSGKSGLDVDKDCALTVITSSEIVAKSGNSKIPDITLALYEFESWFGRDLHKPFHIFDVFNNTLDLLFKDSTPGLDFDVKNEYIHNYRSLLDEAKTCPTLTDPNTSDMIRASVLMVLPVLAMLCLFNNVYNF